MTRLITRLRRPAIFRLGPAALIAALAIFVVAIAAAQASKPPRGSTPRGTAQAAAGRLIGAFRAPPGAQPSANDPGPRALFGSPAQRPATPNLVDRHRFFRVPGPTDDALHWVQGHLPAGAHQMTSGSSGGPGRPSLLFVAYALPAGNRAIASRQLMVAVANLGSATVMRVDAQVIWLTIRPASERIPPGVGTVQVLAQQLGQPPSAVRTVADPAQIARIASLVDRLPAAQPGVYSCPADTGALVDLRFISAGGQPRTLAVAKADGSGCGGVSLAINGRGQPGLTGGPKLIQRLDTLLGLGLG